MINTYLKVLALTLWWSSWNRSYDKVYGCTIVHLRRVKMEIHILSYRWKGRTCSELCLLQILLQLKCPIVKLKIEQQWSKSSEIRIWVYIFYLGVNFISIVEAFIASWTRRSAEYRHFWSFQNCEILFWSINFLNAYKTNIIFRKMKF